MVVWVGTSDGVIGLGSELLGVMGVEAVARGYAYDRGDEVGMAF